MGLAIRRCDHALVSSVPPHTRRVPSSTWCLADWCFQSGVVTNLGPTSSGTGVEVGQVVATDADGDPLYYRIVSGVRQLRHHFILPVLFPCCVRILSVLCPCCAPIHRIVSGVRATATSTSLLTVSHAVSLGGKRRTRALQGVTQQRGRREANEKKYSAESRPVGAFCASRLTSFKYYTAQHAPWAVLYLGPMLIGC